MNLYKISNKSHNRELHWYCSRSNSNGATGKINIAGGVNSGQTGLTNVSEHIMSKTMELLDTSAGDPSVVAGTSISGTQIIVKG